MLPVQPSDVRRIIEATTDTERMSVTTATVLGPRVVR
jgi:hypothetical protein